MLMLGLAVTLAMMFAIPAWSGNGQGMGMNQQTQKGGNGDCLAGLPYEALSDAEADGLRYMREEEKLARDVYMAFDELWGHWVFTNIIRSEQRHMDRIGQLLEKYQMDDPIVDDTPGVFNGEEFQALYNQLVDAGKASLVEALRVGATIEDLDIADLKNQLDLADNEDIRTVYQNLMKGSRNHLRAFVYQLSLQGETYVAQYITQEEFQTIIDTAPERGPVDENGEPLDVGKGAGPRWRHRINIMDNATDSVTGDDLVSRRGNGGRGGHGPGDGNGNGGNGPKDGSGNGRKSGDCVNSAIEGVEMLLV